MWTAWLDGEEDYQRCQQCKTGWVEMPRTKPGYEQCGLASAALHALRIEHSGLSWHTLVRQPPIGL